MTTSPVLRSPGPPAPEALAHHAPATEAPARRAPESRPAGRTSTAGRTSAAPTLRTERALLRSGIPALLCVDEVGRGALAGPVTVGVTLIDLSVRSAPTGLRDSKLLTPRARYALAPRLRRWALAFGVGHAQPEEIDAVGIIAALRVAAARAVAQLGVPVHHALLDGTHDWLTPPDPTEALFPDPRHEIAESLADDSALPRRVVTKVRADLSCAGVAAASVLAKCERDQLMVELSGRHPEYGWALNKGYSAPEHIEALRVHGPSELHRLSWQLPGALTPMLGAWGQRLQSPSAGQNAAVGTGAS